jgi:tRNA threonylcarbamoyladenosine biosynthesis protein TsaB
MSHNILTKETVKLLAIETATSWQSVAVTDGERVLALVEQDAEGSHARCLMPAIDNALKSAGIGLRDLTGLAVSIGPGSFTGLRVGLATMLGFRSVLGIPLVLVPTLEAMAWQHKHCLGTVVPVLKSRKNEVYWALYDWLPDGTLKARATEQVGPPEMLGRALRSVAPASLFGDGWVAYRDQIRDALGPEATNLKEEDFNRPSAASVAEAAQSRFDRQEIAGALIAPLYVQRPEAEIKYDEHQDISALERRRNRIAQKLDRTAQVRQGRKKNGRAKRQ